MSGAPAGAGGGGPLARPPSVRSGRCNPIPQCHGVGPRVYAASTGPQVRTSDRAGVALPLPPSHSASAPRSTTRDRAGPHAAATARCDRPAARDATEPDGAPHSATPHAHAAPPPTTTPAPTAQRTRELPSPFASSSTTPTRRPPPLGPSLGGEAVLTHCQAFRPFRPVASQGALRHEPPVPSTGLLATILRHVRLPHGVEPAQRWCRWGRSAA